jgi:hypothetical protein
VKGWIKRNMQAWLMKSENLNRKWTRVWVFNNDYAGSAGSAQRFKRWLDCHVDFQPVQAKLF